MYVMGLFFIMINGNLVISFNWELNLYSIILNYQRMQMLSQYLLYQHKIKKIKKLKVSYTVRKTVKLYKHSNLHSQSLKNYKEIEYNNHKYKKIKILWIRKIKIHILMQLLNITLSIITLWDHKVMIKQVFISHLQCNLLITNIKIKIIM